MARRQTGGYDLSQTAQQIVDAIADRRGMKKNLLVTRVMDWFARQDAAAQTAILEAVDQGMEQVYADALHKLARELEQKAAKRRQG